MTGVVRTVLDRVRNLWDIICGVREEDTERSPAGTSAEHNPQHHQNNNGICSLGRKRKFSSSDPYALALSGDSASCPKYLKIVSSMSEQKKRINGRFVDNGMPSASGGGKKKFVPTLLKGEGLSWISNPAHKFVPYGMNFKPNAILEQSRVDHEKVKSIFDDWDSPNRDDYTMTSSVQRVVPVKTMRPRNFTATTFSRRKLETSNPSPSSTASLRQINVNGPFSLLSSPSQPSSKRHYRLYSTTRTNDSDSDSDVVPLEKVTATPIRKPEIITLDEEEGQEDVVIIEPRKPKILTSTPTDGYRFSYGARSPPPLRSTNPSTTTYGSPSQTPPNPKRLETRDDEDDDLQIISENIISPKRNPLHTNSLDLETRNYIFRQKTWLRKSSTNFHESQKHREDEISLEFKKIELLKHRSTLVGDIESRMRKNLTLTDIIILDEGEEGKLPPITTEMRNVIDASVRGRESDVIVTAFSIPITCGDLKTLAPCQWLNDNIINTYMDMIALRSKSDTSLPKVHVFSTFFYPKYLKEGYSSILKRWTRKVDIFSVDLIVFPIHLGIHWCLAIADLRSKTLKFYDSLLGNHPRCLEALMSYLTNEHKERKKSDLRINEWKQSQEKKIPKQENGSDCGVFTCKFAEYLSRDAKLTFQQKNMNYYRDRMVYEIVKQTLIYP